MSSETHFETQSAHFVVYRKTVLNLEEHSATDRLLALSEHIFMWKNVDG